jgi:deazaflavin-dependent oxidoreductase (nitroreductase family)
VSEQSLTPRQWNETIIEEFRANDGKVGGPFEGASLLLITTTGRKTGLRHTTPAAYALDGERILLFASNAGASSDPAWYRNLVADPAVTIELGTTSFPATAVPVEGEERDRLYARQARLSPAFAAYQAKTSRTIPVVAVHRTGATIRRG